MVVKPDKIRITIHIVEPQGRPGECTAFIQADAKRYDLSPREGRYEDLYEEIDFPEPEYTDLRTYVQAVIKNLQHPKA